MGQKLFQLVFGKAIDEVRNPPRETGIRFLDQIFHVGVLRWSLIAGFATVLFGLTVSVIGQADVPEPKLLFALFFGLGWTIIIAVILGFLIRLFGPSERD